MASNQIPLSLTCKIGVFIFKKVYFKIFREKKFLLCNGVPVINNNQSLIGNLKLCNKQLYKMFDYRRKIKVLLTKMNVNVTVNKQ